MAQIKFDHFFGGVCVEKYFAGRTRPDLLPQKVAEPLFWHAEQTFGLLGTIYKNCSVIFVKGIAIFGKMVYDTTVAGVRAPAAKIK